MALAKPILEILAAVFGYFSARGIDAILGKWLAWAVIAWEQRSSEASKAAFNQAMTEIKTDMPAKAEAWENWRRRAANIAA